MLSSGALKIKGILEEKQIPYKMEFKFKDCKDKQMLPFDFAIFDFSGKLLYLIEYDGEQHFKENKKFGYESFKQTKWHDYLKNRFCIFNNIPLIRIPYWEKENICFEDLTLNSKFLISDMYHNEKYYH